jgi:menaquinone-specific isochorismate synthase
MSVKVGQDRVLRSGQAKGLMAKKIKEAYASPALSAHSIDERVVARLEVAVDDITPLSWLAVQKNRIKTYWSDRQGEFEMAGIGTTDIVSGKGGIDYGLLFARLNRLLVDGSKNLHYYGGLRFSDNVNSANITKWEDFGSYRFVIPRFELFRKSGATHLAGNVILSSDGPGADAAIEELGDIVFPVESNDTEPPNNIRARCDCPDIEGWKTMVEAALLSISTTELEKLVLARQTGFDFSSRPKPLYLLERLKQATHRCCHFCFQLDDDLAFVGASPERLYQRSNQTIKSEALAGTCPRGMSKDADEALGEQLLHSEKDIREHQHVAAHVENVLGNLCPTGVHKDGLSLLRLTAVQHLITPFKATLAPGLSDADILAAMHPTPAVGGYPVDLAIEKIQELEPFDRGWYAGPVGWVGRDAAEFAVAIRSGLVAGDKLHLFAGAGIVNGSTAESEWMEIENKLSSFTNVFTTCNVD